MCFLSTCNYDDMMCFNPLDTQFPREVRALLKWKMCSITPNIVKRCITRVGFTKSTSKWLWSIGKDHQKRCHKVYT